MQGVQESLPTSEIKVLPVRSDNLLLWVAALEQVKRNQHYSGEVAVEAIAKTSRVRLGYFLKETAVVPAFLATQAVEAVVLAQLVETAQALLLEMVALALLTPLLVPQLPTLVGVGVLRA